MILLPPLAAEKLQNFFGVFLQFQIGVDSSDDGNGAKQITIQKLLIPVDLKKIKDLQQLLELLEEVEDFANANGSEETADDLDAVTA